LVGKIVQILMVFELFGLPKRNGVTFLTSYFPIISRTVRAIKFVQESFDAARNARCMLQRRVVSVELSSLWKIFLPHNGVTEKDPKFEVFALKPWFPTKVAVQIKCSKDEFCRAFNELHNGKNSCPNIFSSRKKNAKNKRILYFLYLGCSSQSSMNGPHINWARRTWSFVCWF
jgi:hypothetical protein